MKALVRGKLLSLLVPLSAVLSAGPVLAQVGASTPFVTLEAEAGTLGGGATLRALAPGPLPAASTPELEASGRQFVQLDATGESVSWTNTTGIAIDRMVIRASIPDAPGGGGITATLNLYVDGVMRQAITLSSHQSWVYGTGTWDNNSPSGGAPQRFYDDQRVAITGTPIAPGSRFMLRKDAANTAAFYHLDLVDVERAPAARVQPTNTLSITSYGAVADDNGDDSDAIQNCINAAQAQGKGVWIPAGRFDTRRVISAKGITLSGAGMWYTTLYRDVPIPNQGIDHWWELENCTLRDVFIDVPSTGRNRNLGASYGLTLSGATGWLVERVWIQHTDAAMWASGSHGTVRDSRILNPWADGINLNSGPGADHAGYNLTAQNNYVRGSGDDGLAINADVLWPQMDTVRLLNNTSICAVGANTLRIAGGRNVTVQGNLVADPAQEVGMVVGVFHAGRALESALVQGNTILRGGGFRPYGGVNAAAVIGHDNTPVAATFDGNLIIDSLGEGVLIGTYDVDLVFSDNTITHPAANGIRIKAGTTGTGDFELNTVSDLANGQLAFVNGSSGFATTFAGNSWDTSAPGVVFFQDINYGGVAGPALPVGNYTLAQLSALGVPNDWASSVRVPSGRTLIMYSDDNFSGASWTRTADTPDFTTLSPNANNVMSSCRIQ
ncbi:glycosyl hydrolase family 28-related protein [Cystobacter fuscus]|uniref:glycosyl hydrolase family 28-related protein n=1 Tax=Cystobacter fuscus TaxID=43 RepID=UPI001FE18D8D|nr:glycosyl hydrolase family 28-related protein [Cystobacter fuscus]